MLTPTEAAWQTKVSQRVLYRWIEAGLIHFTETVDGGVFICLSSLTGPLIDLSESTKGKLQ
jgi:excisionase family DNA binding protein